MGLTTLPSRTAAQSRALLVYVDTLGPRLFGLGHIHALLDIRCKIEECILDVDVVLGRDLQEWYSKVISEPLALLGGHSPLLFPVAFISDKDLVHALACMLLNVREPGTDV